MRARLPVVAFVLLPLAVAWQDTARAAGTAALGGDLIRAGAVVLLEEPVGGDALLAGGSVESNASIEGDASVAGGQVAIRATVGDDLYVAAGQVEVDALVAGNARLAAGRVVILPESRIQGGVAIAGATVDVRGRFGRYLTVMGGEVTLGGDIAGDVRVYARGLTVLPGTRIGGELIYRTAGELALPDDAEIGGSVRREDGDTAGEQPAWRPGISSSGVGWIWLAGLFALGLLLVLALARYSHRTTAALTGRPWFGMAVGFVTLVCMPAFAVMLFITLVGIPLALLLLLVYLAMLIAGYVIGALYLGDSVLAATLPTAGATALRRMLALLLVLLALALLGSVPMLGSMARFAVLLLGLGGMVLALRLPLSSR